MLDLQKYIGLDYSNSTIVSTEATSFSEFIYLADGRKLEVWTSKDIAYFDKIMDNMIRRGMYVDKESFYVNNVNIEILEKLYDAKKFYLRN